LEKAEASTGVDIAENTGSNSHCALASRFTNGLLLVAGCWSLSEKILMRLTKIPCANDESKRPTPT
jgi:hypothetical protein